jgi:hypothetical protein
MREMSTKMLLGSLKGRELRIHMELDHSNMGFGGVDWIHLVYDRNWWQAFWKTALNLQVPQKAGNFLTRWVCCQLLKKGSAAWSYSFIYFNNSCLSSHLIFYFV